MLGKGQGRLSIRARPAHNEVITSNHQNADHAGSCFQARIRNGATDCKVIDNLL
jgi:hypothetical protein